MDIDFQGISQQLRVRPEILKKLTGSFANALTEKMNSIETALGKNDAMQMRLVLHEIKGTAGNLRLEGVAAAEKVMHDAVKAGEAPEKLREYFTELKSRVAELQQYMAKQGS